MRLWSKTVKKVTYEKSFRYEFTPKELRYFLFKKKICPNCGQLLEKERVANVSQDSILHPGVSGSGIEATRYSYQFNCKACEASFSLSELAELSK